MTKTENQQQRQDLAAERLVSDLLLDGPLDVKNEKCSHVLPSWLGALDKRAEKVLCCNLFETKVLLTPSFSSSISGQIPTKPKLL